MRCELDHLVVACATLDQGEAWLVNACGVAPQPGGRHVTMGTHNRVLRLGARVYLELIAIDPDGVEPAHARWFGLDSATVRERAAEMPFLVTWAARCDDLDAVCAQVPALGEPTPFERNGLAWRFSVRADGELQFDGALPSVLQWQGDVHPCDRLEDRGCTLLSLEVSHPQMDAVRAAYRALRVTGPIELRAGDVKLTARIDTPTGERTIS